MHGTGVDEKVINISLTESFIDEGADIILLPPQVRYELNHLQDIVAPAGKIVAVIDMKDYGLMECNTVLDKALKLLASS